MEKLKKKVGHFVLVLAAWTVIYFVFDIFFMKYTFTKTQIINLLFKSAKPHLWFMYAIIGLYVISPFARILVKNMTKAQAKYFVWLWIGLTGGLKIFRLVLSFFHVKTSTPYPVPLVQTTYYFGYFVVGYLLYREIREEGLYIKPWICATTIVLCDIIMVAATYLNTLKNSKFYNGALMYRGLFVMLSAMAIFIWIVESKPIAREKAKKWLGTLSPLLFGVYLIHIIFYDLIVRLIKIKKVNAIVGVPLFSVLTFAVSLFCIWLLRKIPGVKKIVQ